jgi:hypothetical protein
MAALQKAPFSLAIGTSVLAKVVAVNRVGNSPESLVGGSAVSAVVPDEPVSLTRDSSITTIH